MHTIRRPPAGDPSSFSRYFPQVPPQMMRDVARDELLTETMRRQQEVRWTASDWASQEDRLLDYQRGKPCAMNDQVMGHMRLHLFSGLGLLKPHDSARLMVALEKAKVVSHAPRRLIDVVGLDGVLNKFRKGPMFGKALSAEKKRVIRDTLLTFERIALQREKWLNERATHREALSQKLAAQTALLDPYGQDRQWYRTQMLADGSVQHASDAYVRCTELLRTHPSQFPAVI